MPSPYIDQPSDASTIYRSTVRCLHRTLICMILRRTAIGLTQNFQAIRMKISKLSNYDCLAFIQNRRSR